MAEPASKTETWTAEFSGEDWQLWEGDVAIGWAVTKARAEQIIADHEAAQREARLREIVAYAEVLLDRASNMSRTQVTKFLYEARSELAEMRIALPATTEPEEG